MSDPVARPTALGVRFRPDGASSLAARLDLVGAPVVGDPRIQLEPRRVSGRAALPQTGPGGVQAWKIVTPASPTAPSRPGERMLVRASGHPAPYADPHHR